MRGLNGKRVILTGGGSGIGRAVCERFGEEGAEVAVFDMNEEGAQETVQHILDAGGKAKAFKVDITDRAQVDKAVAEFEAGGPVDILVNNAGWDVVKPFLDSDAEHWKKLIDINLYGPLNMHHAVLPGMVENGKGRVVNIASAHGLTASPYKSAYVTAKHGVVGMTKVAALETAEDPITCNAICPGYVLTPLVEAQIPDTMKKYDMDRETVVREVLLERQPSKQFATVEQIGGTVVFLCSDHAEQITGTTISVDGGWTAL